MSHATTSDADHDSASAPAATSKFQTTINRILQWPVVAHLIRSLTRFNDRFGNQFAAAITYFSVLALVPILMFAFAVLGFILTVLQPSLQEQLRQFIVNQLGTAQFADNLTGTLIDTLSNWRGVTIVALISVAYAGAGWVENLSKAVDAMWQEEITAAAETGGGILGWVLRLGRNLLVLLGLVLLGGVTVFISMVGTTARGWLVSVLNLSGSGLANVLTSVGTVLLSLLVGWALFLYLYSVLPSRRRSFREVARGAVIGSVGLAGLQYFAGILTTVFSNNRAAVLFGPLIVLMLSLNIFAMLVMIGAAWASTTDSHAAVVTDAADPGDAEPDVAELAPPPEVMEQLVPQRVAQRGVSVGMGAGYVVGGATGIGVGALVGSVLARIAARRRSRR